MTTPPNSQGLTALLMLQAMRPDAAPGTLDYLDAFVAAKVRAFALRDAHLTDPAHMRVGAEDLLAGRVSGAAPTTAPVAGDTVYACAVDAEGNACSLIQSLYYGFGACFVAGDTGILLHNRAHYFALRPDAANVLAPGKRTLHTLMACMALEDGRPRFVFGAMGADGQPQANVQVLHRLLAGATPAEAVAAPRVLHGRFALEDDPDTLKHVEADTPPRARRAGGPLLPRRGPPAPQRALRPRPRDRDRRGRRGHGRGRSAQRRQRRGRRPLREARDARAPAAQGATGAGTAQGESGSGRGRRGRPGVGSGSASS